MTAVRMTQAQYRAALHNTHQSQQPPRRRKGEAKGGKQPLPSPAPIFEVFEGCVTVEVPLPPSELSSNGTTGRGWRKKVRTIRDFRDTCAVLFGNALRKRGREFKRVRISYTWYMAPCTGDGLYRPKDRDNALAALKACQDGMRDSGLISDDTADVVTLGEVVLLRTAAEHGGRRAVVVRVEEVGE